MTRFGRADLQSMDSIAAASITRDGTLQWGNEGFLRLFDASGRTTSGSNLTSCFLQPTFDELIARPPDADGLVHRGLVTIGHSTGLLRSLRARLWTDGVTLDLLAEHDIADLERLNTTVLLLNKAYDETQLALTRTNLEMKQLNALLEKQNEELEERLLQVRQLEGIISICMNCRQVRAADDSWQKLEQYVGEHSDARFSHGLCPDCVAVEMEAIRARRRDDLTRS